jgi:hypothetical protein
MRRGRQIPILAWKATPVCSVNDSLQPKLPRAVIGKMRSRGEITRAQPFLDCALGDRPSTGRGMWATGYFDNAPDAHSFLSQKCRWPGPPPRTESVWDMSIRGRRPGRSSTCETITPESWRVALRLDGSGRCPEKCRAMRVSAFIEPCLPSPADRLPSGPDWIQKHPCGLLLTSFGAGGLTSFGLAFISFLDHARPHGHR